MSGPIFERTTESLELLSKEIRGGMNVMKPYDVLQGLYPLGVAALKGNAQACRLLLEAGARPNEGGIYFASSPAIEVVKSVCGDNRLKGMGMPDPEVSLSHARDVIKVLVEYGADLSGKPVNGHGKKGSYDTPLHYAVENKNHEMVRLLAEFGADLEVKAFTDEIESTLESPLGRAQVSNDQDMMITLLRLGANGMNIAGQDRARPPVVGAVIAGLDRVVEYLLTEGGEDFAQRFEGRTLLQHARADSTRQLLRSMKTELAAQNALAVQTGGDPVGLVVKKDRELML
jgi:ankyrin repeat protein